MMKKHGGTVVVVGFIAALGAFMWWAKGDVQPKTTGKGAPLPTPGAS